MWRKGGGGRCVRMRVGGLGLRCGYKAYKRPNTLRRIKTPEFVRPEGFLRHVVATPEEVDDSMIFYKDHDFLVLYEPRPISSYHLVFVSRNLDVGHVRELVPEHLPSLRLMRERTADIVQHLRTQQDSSAVFRAGFQAVPYQDFLHLHLLSMDLSNARNKRSFNGFASRFFVDIDEAIDDLGEFGKVAIHNLEILNSMAQKPYCPRCGVSMHGISEMKTHLFYCSQSNESGNLLRVRSRIYGGNLAKKANDKHQ